MNSNSPAKWFRLYAEFVHDPKVQMLSEIDQRRYIMLLCVRCSNGNVTLHETELAFQLRISVDDLRKTAQNLLSKNLIDSNYSPTAWNKRQYVSDSSSARVSKYRALLKQQSNDDVTLQSRPRDRDRDRDREEENNNRLAQPVAQLRKPALRKPDPDGFTQFWERYPKRRNKGDARKAFAQLKPDADLLEKILTGIDRSKRSNENWKKSGGQFIPYPGTWLRAAGWEDDLTPQQVGGDDKIVDFMRGGI